MVIENNKKLKAFIFNLKGNNLRVSGPTGTGKTTAISALWEIMKKVSDPLTHGEKKGRICITLGDENKKVFAERKFTNKTNSCVIMKIEDNENKKISVNDFSNWVSKLGINPHKLIDMGPLEQTEMLLESAKIPDGIDIIQLDKDRGIAETERTSKFQEWDRQRKSLGDTPEEVKKVELSSLLMEQQKIIEDNKKIEDVEFEYSQCVRNINSEDNKIIAYQEKIEELKKRIEELKKCNVASEKIISHHNQQKNNHSKWLKENTEIPLDEINKKITNSQTINDKAKKYTEYQEDKKELEKADSIYRKAIEKVNGIDEKKKNALDNAEWPIKGLSIVDGQITYGDILLSNLGKSEQLLVCGALAAKTIQKAPIKVVRMDGIESMDPKDFNKLEKIFNDNDVQVLSSRVSRGDKADNEIIIEEGVYEDNNDKKKKY